VALVEAAADSGAAGYLLKSDVRLQIAWALVYAGQRQLDFVVTATVARFCAGSANRRLLHAYTLPERRKFPELTDRIHQALWLCVVKGMPAQLAADEMGISLHTIRGYIKEGYRILEAYDETEFPLYMTPQEKAFMRLTAFADDDDRSRPSLAH
jgi:DNA-binding NarL/FixJ family response regulator